MCVLIVQLCVIPRMVACQAPLSMEFSRQEYWDGLPFPTPGDFPDSGTEPASAALEGRFFTTEPHRKVKVKSLSRVRLFVTPRTVAHKAPLSMGFSRQG